VYLCRAYQIQVDRRVYLCRAYQIQVDVSTKRAVRAEGV